MIDFIALEDIDCMFDIHGYKRFNTDCGFFYLEFSTDTAILFDINNKTVSVYDYETMYAKSFNDNLLDLIVFAFIRLGWC